MQVLSHHWSDLCRGYESIVRLDQELHQEWDRELSALEDKVQQAYRQQYNLWQAAEAAWQAAERKKDTLHRSAVAEWKQRTELLLQAYQQKLADWQIQVKQKKKQRNTCLILAIVCLLLIFTGLLICQGVIGFGIFVAMWTSAIKELAEVEKQKPEPIQQEPEPQRAPPGPRPLAPSRTALARPRIDLVEMWWNYLGAQQAPARSHGDEGEQKLLQALGGRLPDKYLALRQVLIGRSIDIDVLVLGPNGLWLLESKFWSGKVVLRNGNWKRIKTYYEPGGLESTKEEDIKSFDQEWLFEEESIWNRLSYNHQDLPPEQLLKGGIVFTHPEVELDIDASCRAEYGDIDKWVEKIRLTPALEGFTTQRMLNIVDRLMFFAAPLEGIAPSSAAEITETLCAQTRTQLEMYRNRILSSLEESKPD